MKLYTVKPGNGYKATPEPIKKVLDAITIKTIFNKIIPSSLSKSRIRLPKKQLGGDLCDVSQGHPENSGNTN